jgi:hypothetical protein
MSDRRRFLKGLASIPLATVLKGRLLVLRRNTIPPRYIHSLGS